jgi:hypothetical protein
MWEVIKNEIDETHVIPQRDLKPHTENAGCWCQPFDDEGIWVHNSLDQREAIEQGRARAH